MVKYKERLTRNTCLILIQPKEVRFILPLLPGMFILPGSLSVIGPLPHSNKHLVTSKKQPDLMSTVEFKKETVCENLHFQRLHVDIDTVLVWGEGDLLPTNRLQG